MERKHLILLSLCCLCIYVVNARVISKVKSTKVRTIKIPACGCNRPAIDVPPCGCRGLGFEAPYGCTCDLDIRRPCGCQKPVYIDPIDIPLCSCGSGLPLATVVGVEMPCGCQSLDTCTCGYQTSAMPFVYDFVEVPSCGCQSTVKPCSCQPINACGCQNPMTTCGCQSLNTCGCQGFVWMNYDCMSPYDVSPCRCNFPVSEITCGCQAPGCGCCGVQLSSPFDCLAPIMESCGCLIPTMSEVPIYSCGCQNSPCGCQNSPRACSCPSSPCGCNRSLCGCESSPCRCQSSPCGCLSSPCGCGGGCGCGVTLPSLAPVVGCTKYLRQVTLQPPFL